LCDFGVEIATDAQDARDQDFRVGRPVDDLVLSHTIRADSFSDFGPKETQIRESSYLGKGGVELLPVGTPLCPSPLLVCVKQNVVQFRLSLERENKAQFTGRHQG
jgi:hypothetical protein